MKNGETEKTKTFVYCAEQDIIKETRPLGLSEYKEVSTRRSISRMGDELMKLTFLLHYKKLCVGSDGLLAKRLN